MKVRKVWRVKVGECKCFVLWQVKATPLPQSIPFPSLFNLTQNSINSWRREPKLRRWPPACQRPPVAIQAQHRELPTARSQRDKRMDCSPCRRPFRTNTWTPTNLTLKCIATVPSTLFSNYRALWNREKKLLCKSLVTKGKVQQSCLFGATRWFPSYLLLIFFLKYFPFCCGLQSFMLQLMSSL